MWRCIVFICVLAFINPFCIKAEKVDTLGIGKEVYLEDKDSLILFRFMSKRKMFFRDYKTNFSEIKRAAALVTSNFHEIRGGKIKVEVNGYCSSYPSRAENLRIAKNRSNQVKSYYITNHGLKEDDYRTRNHAFPYRGDANVVAMLRLVKVGDKEAPMQVDSLPEEPERMAYPDVSPVMPELPVAVGSGIMGHYGIAIAPEAVIPAASDASEVDEAAYRRWNLKTNVPAWALVVGNIGVEYAFSKRWSVDVPVYYLPFTVKRNYRFRMLAVQPSVRYWFGNAFNGHFVGVHLTAGQYNVAVNKRYRYQDVDGMWGAGIDYGFALPLSSRWGLEFNIGAGAIYSKYDTFYNIHNGAKRSTATKTYWGITRAAISVVYNLK